jgi:hypothetical protein
MIPIYCAALMAQSDIPAGHEPGKRWCTPCYVVIREPLEDCPRCDGLLHRMGSERICDKCECRLAVGTA